MYNNRQKIQLSYIAGLIDSDGSLSIIKSKTNIPSRIKYKRLKVKYLYQAWIQISQIDSQAIQLVKKIFPKYNAYYEIPKKNKRNKFCRIIFTGQQAYRVAEEILPYLYIKKQQAKTILKFRKLNQQRPKLKIKINCQGKYRKFKAFRYRLSKNQIIQREKLVKEIRNANGTL